MRQVVTLLLLIVAPLSSIHGQELTYYNSIKHLFSKNCVPCHRNDGIGPFSLDDYKQIKQNRGVILSVLNAGYMPPWKPDPSYSHFLNERILTDSDKQKITGWIRNGCKIGSKEDDDLIREAALPQSPKADLVLKLPFPVYIQASNRDSNAFIEMPYELPNDTFISYYEFVSSYKSGIHHVMIYIQDAEERHEETNFGHDSDDKFDGNFWDGKAFHYRAFSSRFLCFAGGWIPGQLGITMPKSMGFRLPRKGILVYQIHYGPSAVAIKSDFELRLTFSKEKIERIARAVKFGSQGGIVEPYPPLLVPPDTVMRFTLNTIFPDSYSIIAMSPHMHLLGRSFRVWLIDPRGDTTKLINIKDWDFNWQGYYYPPHLIKVEKGSMLQAEVILDNTQNNIKNPNHPPRFVKYGNNTSDEMIQFSIYVVPYKKGDEELSVKEN
ncbi:MAG: hypothetical protein JWO03_790 [Bacteroidetes bacterium]|nr:hypothetical protein [Bacteroidota bacterium]